MISSVALVSLYEYQFHALGPMESPVEHGGNRTLYAHLITEYYADDYTALSSDPCLISTACRAMLVR